jgi:glutathione peroxidase-family protein
MTTLADFTVTTNRGEELDLADKLGKVVLVVNTASKCGFTPQYDGLESFISGSRTRTSRFWVFPATNSARRSREARTRLQNSARSISASLFRSWPRLMLTAQGLRRCSTG